MAVNTYNITATNNKDFLAQLSSLLQSNGWTLEHSANFCSNSVDWVVLSKNGLYLSAMSGFLDDFCSSNVGTGLFFFQFLTNYDSTMPAYDQPSGPFSSSVVYFYDNSEHLYLLPQGASSVTWPVSALIAIDDTPDKWLCLINVKEADPTKPTASGGWVDFVMPDAIDANTSNGYQDLWAYGGYKTAASPFGYNTDTMAFDYVQLVRKYANGDIAGCIDGNTSTANVVRWDTNATQIGLHNASLDKTTNDLTPYPVSFMEPPPWNTAGRGGFTCCYLSSKSHPALDPPSEQINVRISSMNRPDVHWHLNRDVDVMNTFNLGVNTYAFFPIDAQEPLSSNDDRNIGFLVQV